MKKKYSISGKVLTTENNQPAAGVRVEAWDKDLIFDDLVGSCETDEEGGFTMSFDEGYYKELFFDRKPDLFFRVFYRETMVLDTRDAVSWNVKDKNKVFVLHVAGASVGLPGSGTPAEDGIKLDEIGKLAGLNEQVLTALKERNILVEDAGEATLSALEKEKIITAAQKKELQLVVAFARLGGENLALAGELKKAAPESPVQLVSWEQSDWKSFLQDKKIPIPPDETDAAGYAENLRYMVELSFPSHYFLHRVINNPAAPATGSLVGSIAALFQHNTVIVSPDPHGTVNYNWEGISEKNQQAIRASLAQLVPLVNTYRGLGLTELLNDEKLSTEQKQRTAGQRVTALSTFYKNNPDIDLYHADFVTSDKESRTDGWNWNEIDAEDRPFVKKQMAASQRMFVIGGDFATGEMMMKKGYDSAASIASVSEEMFIANSGLDQEKGKKTYAKANTMAAASSHYFELVRDAVRGTFKDIAVNNQDKKLVNDLKEIDGYEDLFGNQDYCECEACRSILSPAAYFADLMYFVHVHVSKQVFLPSKADHPLYLKNRRPDLWTLKLSCKNTSTEIPYLQVVNEVLENYLAAAIPSNDVYEILRLSDRSCRQPFNLRLEETRLYLSHFDLSLAHIYHALNLPAAEQDRERLRLSAEELQLILTPDAAGAHKRFGNIPLANFNVQDFIRLAGITRDELDDLLASAFATVLAPVNIKMIKAGTDIQQYREELTGLTAAILDVIHRYLRLWKKTAWTLREFDMLLHAMKSSGLLASLEELDAGNSNYPKVLQLAWVQALQLRLGCTPEEMATILYRLPLLALTDGQQPFYGRIFDLEKIFGNANANAASTVTLPADKANDKITPLILAGLGISEAELDMLYDLTGIDTSVDQVVGIDFLSSLYRHALLARGLKLGIEDFVHLTELINGQAALSTLPQMAAVADAESWQRKSPFRISEMRLILAGSESSDLLFSNDVHVASAAVQEIQAGVLSDKKPAVDLLKAFLQRTFNLTAAQLEDEFLQHITPCDLNGAAITLALGATFTNGKPDTPADLNGLIDLLRKMERYQLLFSKAQIDAEMTGFLVGKKEVAGITNFSLLNYTHLVNIVRYHELFSGRDALRPVLFAALDNIQASGNFTPAENATLADAWEQPESLVTSLTGALSFSTTALEAVDYLHTVLGTCVTLGIQGDALLKLKKSDKPGLEAARNVVLGAFASKYPDEAVRNEKSAPYADRLNMLKRDALCDYIISRSDVFKFKDRNDLYHFFLLDVEMSGCFRTSYLVAAITSLQHYIHRCLINLEQSDELLNPDIPDIKVSPALIPADEWEWRKNYRVWEANRKVFLYPENYIVPSLRDNKTEIFKSLEDELLQQKITRETAEAAYKKYLAGFAELTRLRYSGGYYEHVSALNGFMDLGADAGLGGLLIYIFLAALAEADSEESKFHLFGRTNVQPYKYYHRTYNHYKKTWTSWKSIDLGIEAAEVSAIIFQGKLYIYWMETQSKEVNKISGGNSTSSGMLFKAYVKYSFLDENDKWSAPQRLYIGQNFVGNLQLYGRVWQGWNPDAETQEKTHDATVEKFQELVFRKPYAISTGDLGKPILLRHIWSHSKSESNIQYHVNSQLIDAGSAKIHFPAVSFTIINNDFTTNASHIKTSGILEFSGFTFDVSFDVHIAGPCYCDVLMKPYQYHFTVPVSSSHDNQGTPLKTTVTELSLSRNTVMNMRKDDILGNADNLNSYPERAREYTAAFCENGQTNYYIENGRESFTDHQVSQTPQNEALLHVDNPATGNTEPVLLSTILTDELGDILYSKGLKQFLSLTTQQLTDEHGQRFDFRGAYGDYYWEMFFHVPFLIADHLNANQKFKEAKWWYERIFDPTSDEQPTEGPEHNWQFREFRGLSIEKLKDILVDQEAIETYKKDPFNPHAIARLRLSAYQKTIVMHYIDNLLDWGDHLFMQDTRESINEAEMLYQMAADILGRRPVKVGKCETANENALTYTALEPKFENGAEFLVYLENYSMTQQQTYGKGKKLARTSKGLDAMAVQKPGVQKSFGEVASKATYVSLYDELATQAPGSAASSSRNAPRTRSYKKMKAKKKKARNNAGMWKDADQYKNKIKKSPNPRMPGHDLVKQYSLAFCVPPNTDLIKYWDRVEDRLYKIRNCMNIRGIRRSLSLFQPPIDPMLLVRARAAGLSLEDITAMIAGSSQLPAYRFTFLLEKARQFTQTVQSFGTALLSALEKKDGEELLMLRTVHEKNILKLTRAVKRNQLREAQQQYKAAEAGLANVQNRVDYYQGLVDTGLIPWEVTEQVSKWTAGSIRIGEATLGFMASAFGFLPQIGSPFAMKYGGQELKNGVGRLADATGTLAVIADNIAILAGLEATHQRREQDWRQQLKLAQQEHKQSGILLLAAEIRQQLAEQELQIHEKNMEQSDEVFDFYKNKFTGLSLYNYLASTLNRIYRDAYNIAADLAKQAETAYRFERFDNEVYIQADNWQFDRAGLLAGEQLLLQLSQLEKKFLDTNVRQPEITQTFSLASLSPIQLLSLRRTGSCTISIPEIAFEAQYPGQYRRVIKSVRVTIPCVAGQYTNISARLTLTKGEIEYEHNQPLEELLVAKNTSISTSSGNSDGGAFELNFRDERYLPFEGAGAISEWLLELPGAMRSFNYDSISDVLLHISYSAYEGDRAAAEAALAATITSYGNSTGFYRLISLRHEFPEALHQLFSQPQQATSFALTKAHFPYLLTSDPSKNLVIPASSTRVYVKPVKGATASASGTVKINGNNAVDWSDTSLNIPAGAAATDQVKGGIVNLSGNPVKTWTIDAGLNGIDKNTTEDILILVRYKTS